MALHSTECGETLRDLQFADLKCFCQTTANASSFVPLCKGFVAGSRALHCKVGQMDIAFFFSSGTSACGLIGLKIKHTLANRYTSALKKAEWNIISQLATMHNLSANAVCADCQLYHCAEAAWHVHVVRAIDNINATTYVIWSFRKDSFLWINDCPWLSTKFVDSMLWGTKASTAANNYMQPTRSIKGRCHSMISQAFVSIMAKIMGNVQR